MTPVHINRHKAAVVVGTVRLAVCNIAGTVSVSAVSIKSIPVIEHRLAGPDAEERTLIHRIAGASKMSRYIDGALEVDLWARLVRASAPAENPPA